MYSLKATQRGTIPTNGENMLTTVTEKPSENTIKQNITALVT